MSLLRFWATFQEETTVELMNQYKKTYLFTIPESLNFVREHRISRATVYIRSF